MVAAFTENFDQITRKDKRSPALKGTTAAGAGLADLGGAGLECLVWPAQAQTAPRKKTYVIASITDSGIRLRLEVARSIVSLDAPLHTLRSLRLKRHKYRRCTSNRAQKDYRKSSGSARNSRRGRGIGRPYPASCHQYSFGGRPTRSELGMSCCP